MITLLLIIIVGGCMILLFPYTIGYLIALLTPTKKNTFDDANKKHGSISILIPSHNEGTGLIDCITSLLDQTYTDQTTFHILIQDTHDSSYSHLVSSFHLKNNGSSYIKEGKKVVLHLTGKKDKKDKINYLLPQIEARFIGFIDADHRADKQRVSSSLDILEHNNSVGVQSIRKPLSVRHFFQVYDSLQNHLGNEILNNMYHSLGYTVFFTGTTCIFDRKRSGELMLSTCMTEDTHLSYKLITNSKQIDYNGAYGSYEEVAPDYLSYFKRRRRRSNGHIQTMKDFFSAIGTSQQSLSQKILLYFHSFYYAAGCVLLLSFLTLSIWYIVQYPTIHKLIILLLTILLGFIIGWYHNKNTMTRSDFLTTSINIFPWLPILGIRVARFTDPELFHTFISFPYETYIFYIGFFALILAYLPIIKGSIIHKRPSLGQTLLHGLAYPFMLLIDIYAISAGVSDLITGKSHWHKITRSGTIDSDIANNITHSRAKPVTTQNVRKILLTLLGLCIVSIGINDFFPKYTCGEKEYLFGKHIVYNQGFDIQHTLQTTKKTLDDTSFSYTIQGTIIGDDIDASDEPLSIEYILDNKQIYTDTISTLPGKVSFSHTLPMGREQKKLEILIQKGSFSCKQTHAFTTVVKELRGNTFLINNEPFLIKGIIPSFSHALVDEKDAYTNIKKTGANAVRLYHNPGDSALDILEDLELLVMSQPNNSTWDNIDIEKTSDQKKLIQRYKNLYTKMEGYPYSLFVGLGNELELPENSIEKIQAITSAIATSKKENIFPVLYATYATYLDTPSDIIAINMLDTGETYRNKALTMLSKKETPFFASEFGGFLAGGEKNIPPELRIHRMYTYTKALETFGAIGSMFFQSHDNWGQPIIQGHNDPFTPDFPDDIRGYRERDNTPKPELHHLKNLFSDFIFSSNNSGKITLQNKREYVLSNIFMTIQDGKKEEKISLGELQPGDTYITNIGANNRPYTYKVTYTTHTGLQYTIEHEFNPIYGKRETQSPLKEIALTTTYSVGKRNERIEFEYGKVPTGEIDMRIDLPNNTKTSDLLKLSGLGASSVRVAQAGTKETITYNNTQPYRDLIIPLKELSDTFDINKQILITFERKHIIYIPKNLNTQENKDILIDVEQPILYRLNEI